MAKLLNKSILIKRLRPDTKESGVIVIVTMLLIGIMLAIVLSLSLIFIPKIKSASDTKRSVAAIYAADTAIEWCLYVNRIGSTALPTMSNGAVIINGVTNAPFVAADCAAATIKALGTYQGVTRSLEVTF
ncbi:MAG: hypothetical protein AAB784_02995 [Patescibacteria group bacterium]